MVVLEVQIILNYGKKKKKKKLRLLKFIGLTANSSQKIISNIAIWQSAKFPFYSHHVSE